MEVRVLLSEMQSAGPAAVGVESGIRVLLVARSVTHHGGHDAIHRLAAEVADAVGGQVAACFLDGAVPSLHEALDAARFDRVAEVVLVATHLPPDRYLDIWLRRAYAHWRADRDADGDDRPLPLVTIGASLAGQPALITAVVEALDAAPAAPTGGAGPFRSPAWSVIPRHRNHVLVCRGPRCSAYGANEVAAALGARLSEHGLGDDDVLGTSTGCLFPCNLGPLVVVHPDDLWYPRVDAALAVRIVDEHLRDGQPISGRAMRRDTDGP